VHSCHDDRQRAGARASLSRSRRALPARAQRAVAGGLGRASRLHRNYVGAIERGEINPTFRIMLKLTRGLDVPLSKLIGDFESLRREQQ
jgi:transcriptional regulator with XRE-family HTH domain